MAATKKLKFYSPDGTPIRVTHPDGGVAIVGEHPRELPPKFNREAVKAGCLTTDKPAASKLQGPVVPPAADPFKRREAIKDKIIEALNAAEGDAGFEDAFTQGGLPNIQWLSQAVGFTVERSERDELWQEVQIENEDDTPPEGDSEGEQD